MVSLHVEQPALKTSIFFLVSMAFSYLNSSTSFVSHPDHSATSRRRGHAFQNEAITSKPNAAYKLSLDTHTILPNRTALAATNPSRKGPKPLRWLALNAITPKVRVKNTTVTGSR